MEPPRRPCKPASPPTLNGGPYHHQAQSNVTYSREPKMADDKSKNGKIHTGTVLIILGLIGGPLAVWGESQLERGSTKERLQQIEKRAEEDRRTLRSEVVEVKEHVKLIDQNTQIILQELRVMQALQKQRERESRR
jgi:hypothetical protein